jgi:hypothetical protein
MKKGEKSAKEKRRKNWSKKKKKKMAPRADHVNVVKEKRKSCSYEGYVGLARRSGVRGLARGTRVLNII